jgi:DNA polymerase-1
MMKMTWYKKDIHTLMDVYNFLQLIRTVKPRFVSFDTETDGLHIIKNNPFLLVFGFVDEKNEKGYSYSLDLELSDPFLIEVTLDHLVNEFNKAEKVAAWNAKFDLHMMTNFGRPNLFEHNITDVQIYVRLAHDAIPTAYGGVPMALKAYATKYIDPTARYAEAKLTSERKTLKIKRNKKLIELLQKRTGKKWTQKAVHEMLSDKVLGLDSVPNDIKPIIKEWLDTTPDPDNYRNLNRENVTKYAHLDITYTLEALLLTYPVAIERGQITTITREEKLIYPLYRSERVGFAFNREYAYESKEKLKNYILQKREQLKSLAKDDITVGQHKRIKEVLEDEFDVEVDSTGSNALAHADINNDDAQQFIDVVTELRTLEKWYSTYIIKWINEEHEGRVYTTIHQTGAVSGRVSSDFQQFPQNPIYNDKGELLFHPRRLIKITSKEYPAIAYIDYSQIELRFQALYTVLVSGGDVNLCRAYKPFKCDFREGKWYLKEQPDVEWTPTDLHSLTTKTAFGVDETHPDWKKLRKMGKQTNFACNYGSTAAGLEDALKFDKSTAQQLYNAYRKAFPGIEDYRKYVRTILSSQLYISNLFDRKYYGAGAHKASNYLVQGSSADFLKQKIIEVDEYLKNYKTRFQMNIHDELSFEIHKDELFLIPKLKEIMERLPATEIPIVADLEITYTTWDEKKDYDPEA